jgi:TonB family protein
MKKTLSLIGCFFCCVALLSQTQTKQQESFYLLDQNMNGTTTIEKAKYFIHALKEADSSWLFEKYNVDGPMISSEHYKDDKANTLNGHAYYYNKKGNIDSAGEWSNDLQTGTWGINNEKGQAAFEKTYQQGMLIAIKDYKKAEALEKAKHIDSSKLVDINEMESEFPGKTGAWRSYLEKNLNYPDRALNMKKEGQVTIMFIVDTIGNIINPYIEHSVEYSLEKEALRMITESPKWTPAFQFGRKVKSYKRQSITFKL